MRGSLGQKKQAIDGERGFQSSLSPGNKGRPGQCPNGSAGPAGLLSGLCPFTGEEGGPTTEQLRHALLVILTCHFKLCA